MEYKEEVEGLLGKENVCLILEEMKRGRLKANHVKLLSTKMHQDVYGEFVRIEQNYECLDYKFRQLLDHWWKKELYNQDTTGPQRLISILEDPDVELPYLAKLITCNPNWDPEVAAEGGNKKMGIECTVLLENEESDGENEIEEQKYCSSQNEEDIPLFNSKEYSITASLEIGKERNQETSKSKPFGKDHCLGKNALRYSLFTLFCFLVATGILVLLSMKQSSTGRNLSEPNQLKTPHENSTSLDYDLTAEPLIETENYNNEYILLIAGGAKHDGKLTANISVYPSSLYLEQCLPNLPLPLHWGAIGLLGTHLLLCGGEDAGEEPQSACWILDNISADTAVWRPHSSLTSARSQCASVVSKDGSSLILISGYNYNNRNHALSSVQVMTSQGSMEEVFYRPHSRHAAAITLKSGAILVTGGKESEKEVWMNSEPPFSKWTRKRDMLQGRIGHAAATVRLGDAEAVVVAGGWERTLFYVKELSSVHLYTLSEDKWTELKNMPAPRVDFALQVAGLYVTAVGGHHTLPDTRISPSPWTLHFGGGLQGSWVEQGGVEGMSGAITTTVGIKWVKKLCEVRGFNEVTT